MSLEPYGFDPDALLAECPPKKPETTSSQKHLPDPRIEKKYRLCEFENCFKKACGHMGDIKLCWDCGKRLEREFVSWKKEWRYIYDKNK